MPRVRNRLFYIIFLVLPTTVVRAEESAVPLENDAAKASYELGYSFAGNIEREFGEYIDQAAFMAGSRDALAGQPKRISDTDAKSAYARLTELRVERVKAEGARFLAENGAREGVVTLPSGLQYEILTPGEGPKPTTTDRVKTHYEGRLVDGTVFDSSYRRGEPATFPLNAVIKGWTEGLQLMQVGAKWRLFIPSDLGYGERGAGQSIPPNATLVFDVELLEILGPS